MVIPIGAKVTMKITPERGYQVKEFTGVNFIDKTVSLPGGACVYTFTVTEGNFHLGAVVEKQDDDAKVATSAVEEAAVEIPEGTIDSGTARLYVEDANISADKEAVFEEIASSEGAEIEEVLDISLAQVFFQGTGDDDDVWRNDLEDLDEPALVGLKLKGDYTGKEVEFIHNIHDGDEYEVVEPVEFDPETGEVILPADSFSSYAVAVKDAVEEKVTPSDNNKKDTPAKEAEVKKASDDAKAAAKADSKVSNKAKTGDNVNMMLIVVIMATSLMGVISVYFMKRKQRQL